MEKQGQHPPSSAPPEYTSVQQGAYPPSYPPQGAYPPHAPPQESHFSQGVYPPSGPPAGAYPQHGAYAPGPPHQGPPHQGPPHQGPPPGPYPQPMAYGPGVTVAPSSATVIVGGFRQLGTGPTPTQCPRCQQHIVTQTDYQVGLLTWLIAGALFLFMIWPCCLIPFCVNDCKDVEHICPNCKCTIGRRNRMS